MTKDPEAAQDKHRWSMDNNLSNSANASWQGEATGNEAGTSVASAGDVNNDGYDDILIGAPFNNEGASGAGQSYLILGKASGWSMDNNIGTTSNASWQGEATTDTSGASLAGVGDINNDGYDDIIIGAPFNSEGPGSFAGQVYLILSQPHQFSTIRANVVNASSNTSVGARIIIHNETINSTSTLTLDASTLHLTGSTNISGSLSATGYVNASVDVCVVGEKCLSQNLQPWTNTSNNLTYVGGNVGIGTSTPTFKLEVGGNIGPNVTNAYSLGGIEPFGMDNNLSASSASWQGEASLDKAGESVAGVGDVNGDGYDDIIIGANFNDEGANDAGQAYLILGKASGGSMDNNLSASDASWQGEAEDDRAGIGVAGVGDVNGDGYDDILIGAHQNDEGGIVAGQAYLILGKASGWSMDVNLSNANASWYGETAGDNAGTSVAGVGDVNGDGYDDIIIGARQNDEGGNLAGQVYLILGNATGWSMDNNLSASDASWYGEAEDDRAGWSVAGVGDVNADGYDDIIIGTYLNDEGPGSDAGQVYLILGRSTDWTMDNNLSSTSNASWQGEATGDQAGISIAGAGDVNADGYDDIIIGADENDEGPGSFAGQIYLILGKSSGWTMDNSLSTADASWQGEAHIDVAGWDVAGAGDMNNDGYDDIIIGARENDEGGSGAGQIYLILGKSSGWTMDNSLSTADASWQGEAASDVAGWSVAGAGDVNADGYDDIIIGADDNDEGANQAGQVYLILTQPQQFSELYSEQVVAGSSLSVGGGAWTTTSQTAQTQAGKEKQQVMKREQVWRVRVM